MTPINDYKRPNANATLELWYSGSFSRPFSYARAYLLSPYLNVINFHDPDGEFNLENGFGNALYGWSGSSISLSGSSVYTVRVAQLYALADYWYLNSESFWDYAEADVQLAVSPAIVDLRWTEIASIQTSPNPTIGYPTTFTCTAKDGVPPYTVTWNFGGLGSAQSQAQGVIGEPASASAQFTFPSPGTYNVTATATDSVGISDSKWILVNVTAAYLTVAATSGGTTSPAPGTYAYAKGQQVQVQAQPNSGYVLGWWELDGVISGDRNPFRVIMDQNHTIRAVFVPSLAATLTASPSSGYAPLNATFTCTASGGNPPYTYLLEFGDSGFFSYGPTTSTSAQAWHVYAQVGSFTARLTVTDSAGRKGYDSKTVSAQPQGGSGPTLILSKSNDIAISPGQGASSTITVTLIGSPQPVALSAAWVGSVPAGASASISPSSLVPNGTALLTVSAGEGTPPSAYTCRVTGSAGTISSYVDVTVTVLQSTYYLTILPSDGGTTNPSPGTYAYPAGSTAQVSATPLTGRTLSHWEVDGIMSGGGDTVTVLMNQNHTVRPMFSQALVPSNLTLDVKYFDAGSWRSGLQQYPLDFSQYGLAWWNTTNVIITSPYVIGAPAGATVPITFDPRNTEGKPVSIYGGTPKSKVWSARLYTSDGGYSQAVPPASVTYPSQFQATVFPPPTVLELKLKWVDYPINVTCNAPWGRVLVSSNSPGWGLRASEYASYQNGFGVYYADHGYAITVSAEPFAGYYLDRIEVDGTPRYSSTVSLEDITGPHEIKVFFSATPPTFKLTIVAGEGGTTIPSPGTYAVPRYTVQTATAQVTNSSYYFTGWTIDGVPAGSATKVEVYMDGDKVLLAGFDTDLLGPVGPCSLLNGNMFKRVLLREVYGVNVTWQVPGITQPTQVQVTAWLDPAGAWWYDWATDTLKNTTYKFSGTAVTDSSGRFSIRLGSLDQGGTFYTTSRDPSVGVGSKFYAYANVTAGGTTYNLVSSWKVDNLMPWATFTYNLTGANATITFRYASDGSPVKGRAGYYAASLSAYSPVVDGQLKPERISTPCNDNGTSYLYIPYSEMARERRADASLVVWDAARASQYGSSTYMFQVGWAEKVNITYTAMSAMIYFFNSTHMLVEPTDWGDRAALTPVGGAHAYVYWDTHAYPFNGSGGLVGSFGPSSPVPVVRAPLGEYSAYLNISGAVWPINYRISLSPTKNVIYAIAITYPDAYQVMNSQPAGSSPPRRMYLFLVPGASEGVLYNPAMEMPDLIFHRPPTAEEILRGG
ncbi:MAG: PKD domain-containing protein [Candidatus Methanomethyliaceae archaeon]